MRVSPYNFGTRGNILTKLFQATWWHLYVLQVKRRHQIHPRHCVTCRKQRHKPTSCPPCHKWMWFHIGVVCAWKGECAAKTWLQGRHSVLLRCNSVSFCQHWGSGTCGMQSDFDAVWRTCQWPSESFAIHHLYAYVCHWFSDSTPRTTASDAERSKVSCSSNACAGIVQWNLLSTTEINPLHWGWKLCENKFIPVPTDTSMAPSDVLKVICCKCKIRSNICATGACSCRKFGMSCIASWQWSWQQYRMRNRWRLGLWWVFRGQRLQYFWWSVDGRWCFGTLLAFLVWRRSYVGKHVNWHVWLQWIKWLLWSIPAVKYLTTCEITWWTETSFFWTYHQPAILPSTWEDVNTCKADKCHLYWYVSIKFHLLISYGSN